MVADRYNLNKLVDRETRKEYQVDVANRFSVLESLEISSVMILGLKLEIVSKLLQKRK